MQIKTFNTILEELCDSFDEIISPVTISRSNSNIIYLVFKAIAKGYEIINNVCVSLCNKFNPANCSDEDLDSVADLVGTERLAGSGSGLLITISNPSEEMIPLLAGEYSYALDDDTVFTFEVNSSIEIEAGESVQLIAFSEEIGKYSVTAQDSIVVTSETLINENLIFSCSDNSSLLGTEEETDLAFRKRILSDPNRQNSIVELQTELRNKPYLFDASIYFNNSLATTTVDGISVPPYYMAIFYSGEPKNDIAITVAKKSIFPTVAYISSEESESSKEVYYESEVFADGEYIVNIIPFKKENYSIKVNFVFDSTYTTRTKVKNEIETFLKSSLNTNIRREYIRETEVYTLLSKLNLTGVEILNVDILNAQSQEVPYIKVPISRIPYLTDVIFPLEA